MLVVLFWIWGGLGLILNILMIPSDNTLLLWIGGLLFFGLGGLLFPTAVSVEDTVKGQLLQIRRPTTGKRGAPSCRLTLVTTNRFNLCCAVAKRGGSRRISPSCRTCRKRQAEISARCTQQMTSLPRRKKCKSGNTIFWSKAPTPNAQDVKRH
jgi:hypothetical protein